jgi:hypothetical protein
MPKFLAGCHDNEEEISWHLKKKHGILVGPNEWQQVCNRSNPEKTGRSCEGADSSWLSSKVSPYPDDNMEGWSITVLIPETATFCESDYCYSQKHYKFSVI